MKRLKLSCKDKLSKVKKLNCKNLLSFFKSANTRALDALRSFYDYLLNNLAFEVSFARSSYKEIISSFNVFRSTCEELVNQNLEWSETLIKLQSLYSLYIRNFVKQLMSFTYYKAYIFLSSERVYYLQDIYVSSRIMLFIIKLLVWDNQTLEPIFIQILSHDYLKFFSNPLRWFDLFEFTNSFKCSGDTISDKFIHQRNCCWIMESLCNALIRSTVYYPWFKFMNIISTSFVKHEIEHIPTSISRSDIDGVARFVTRFNKINNTKLLVNIKIFIQKSLTLFKEFGSNYGSFKGMTTSDKHSAIWGIIDTMHLTALLLALEEGRSDKEELLRLCLSLEDRLTELSRLESLNIHKNLSVLLKNRYNLRVDHAAISTRVFGENSIHVKRTSRMPF